MLFLLYFEKSREYYPRKTTEDCVNRRNRDGGNKHEWKNPVLDKSREKKICIIEFKKNLFYFIGLLLGLLHMKF
jgi:hypothetical protein